MIYVIKSYKGKMKIFWDPSYYCNGQCIYCFTSSTHEKEIMSDEYLGKIYKFINEIGADEISIGGGEPFLNGITRICRDLNEEISISVTTNGTICNNEIIQTIVKYRIKVTISLDSLQPDYYKKIRKGLNLNSLLDTIQKLVSVPEIQPNVSLRVTVNKFNLEELTDIVDFCVSNGIPRLKINTTNLYGRAKNNGEIILDFVAFLNKLEEIRSYAKKYRDELVVELPVKKYLENSAQKCTLGNNSLYLDPNGNIYPCAFSENKLCLGNVYLENIEGLMLSINKFSHDNCVCRNCPIHRYENKKINV